VYIKSENAWKTSKLQYEYVPEDILLAEASRLEDAFTP
jgi:hypothetical protein